jgi:prophage regulatory protein
MEQISESHSERVPESALSQFPEIGYVRLKKVLTVIPYKKTTWWDGVKSGRFPKPVKLSSRCTAWRAEEIRGLIKRIDDEARQK